MKTAAATGDKLARAAGRRRRFTRESERKYVHVSAFSRSPQGLTDKRTRVTRLRGCDSRLSPPSWPPCLSLTLKEVPFLTRNIDSCVKRIFGDGVCLTTQQAKSPPDNPKKEDGKQRSGAPSSNATCPKQRKARIRFHPE